MRIEQLTFTRFIAAVAVVAFHFGKNVFPFRHPLLSPIVGASNIGVSYFFILSGFVMIIAYFNYPKINFKNFYLFRISRIFPAFLFSLLLSIIYLHLIGEKIDSQNLLLQLFLLHAWVKKYYLTINFPSWSLSIEILFYVLFPFLFNYFYTKTKRIYTYSFIIVFWIISQASFLFIQNTLYLSEDVKQFSLYFPPFHLNEFLAGNMLGLYMTGKSVQTKETSLFVLLVFLFLLVLLYLDVSKYYYHDGLFSPVFCLLIFLITTNNGFLTLLFKKKFLILLGEISYGIYIYQYPVYKLSSFILIRVCKLHYTSIIFYINLALLLLTSYLSYRFIESSVVKYVKAYVKSHLTAN